MHPNPTEEVSVWGKAKYGIESIQISQSRGLSQSSGQQERLSMKRWEEDGRLILKDEKEQLSMKRWEEDKRLIPN